MSTSNMNYLSLLSPDVRRELLARYVAQAAEEAAKKDLDERGGIWRQLGTPAAPDLSNVSQIHRRLELEDTLRLLQDPYYAEREKLQGMIALVEKTMRSGNHPRLQQLLQVYKRALADLPM